MTDLAASPPLWRRLLTLRSFGVALVLWLVGSFLWIFIWPRGPIPISRETTYLTEPVGPDGYIDYYAALRPDEPIPADDNAAGWYVRAGGIDLHDVCSADDVAELSEALGLPDPDARDRLIPIDEFGPEQWTSVDVTTFNEDELSSWKTWLREDFQRCTSAPWSSAEYPIIQDWLEANERPIELICEGARCPLFQFRPNCDYRLFTIPLPVTMHKRKLADAITIRAMNRVARGELDAAARDVDRLHQMAGHVNDPPFLIETIVSSVINSRSFAAEKALVAALSNTSTVRERRAAIQRHRIPDNRAAVLDLAERFLSLETIQEIDREARGITPAGTAVVPGRTPPRYVRRFQVRLIDTAECSRRINQIYDEMIEAISLPLSTRRSKLEVIESGVKRLEETSDWGIAESLTASCLNDAATVRFVKLATQVDERYSIAASRQKLLDVASAARLFEIDRGRPAKSQADLVPQYLTEWPTDDVRGRPFEDAIINNRWVVFFRSSAIDDMTAEEIANRVASARIDIPYSIDAIVSDP